MLVVKKLGDVLEQVCKVLVVIIFAIMTFAAFMQVVSRTLLGGAWTWTDEMCRYCLVWLAMSAAGYGMRKGTHLSIDTLVDLFPKKLHEIIKALGLVIAIIFGILIIVYGVRLCTTVSFQKSTTLHLSMGLVYSCVPIFGALTVVFCLEGLLNKIFKPKEEGKEE